jgi:hypothetical protein
MLRKASCGVNVFYPIGGRKKSSIATASVASDQIRLSRAKPLRGAEGALDNLIWSEAFCSRYDRRREAIQI